MNSFKSININSCVYVKLTDMGRQIHGDSYHRIHGKHPIIKEDNNGYSKWTLLKLMDQFGCHIHPLLPACFDDDILIDDNDIKSYKNNISEKIFNTIRGKCISDESAKAAAELICENFIFEPDSQSYPKCNDEKGNCQYQKNSGVDIVCKLPERISICKNRTKF